MKRIFYVLCIAVIFFSGACDDEENTNHGNNVIVDSDIDIATIWTSDKIWIVNAGIFVNADLTIEAGTVIKFRQNGSLNIGAGQYGSLLAIGTSEKPILFTSNAVNPAAGDWSTLYFGENNSSSQSSLSYCIIEYGGGDDDGMLGISGSAIKMNYCTLRHSAHQAINLDIDGEFVSCENNSISSSSGHPIVAYSTSVHTLGSTNQISAENGYGISIVGHDLMESVTWNKQDVPYILNEGLFIEYDQHTPELELAPGCTILFAANQRMVVGAYSYGKLVANGTPELPIIFGSAAGTPSAGDWSYIDFGEHTVAGTIMNHCYISYGGNDSDYGMINVMYTSNLTITNCTVSHSEAHGIYLEQSNPVMSANTFENIAGEDIFIAN